MNPNLKRAAWMLNTLGFVFYLVWLSQLDARQTLRSQDGILFYLPCVPFLFVFLSLMHMQKEPARPETIRVPGGRPVAYVLGCIGLLTTLFAIGLAMLPAAGEPNKMLAVAKIVGLTAILIGAGSAIYASSAWRARKSASA